MSTRCPPDQPNDEDRDRATVIPRNDQTNVRSVKLGNHCPTNFRPSFTVMMRAIVEWQKRPLAASGMFRPGLGLRKAEAARSFWLINRADITGLKRSTTFTGLPSACCQHDFIRTAFTSTAYFSSAAGGLHEPSRRKFKCAIL